jgi:hypothetical protein
MDENYQGDGYRLEAPGAETSNISYRLPGRDDPLHVDDYMTDIDFRGEEKIGGEVFQTMGSELPHAAQNGEIDYVLRGLLSKDYCVASDLKTRFGEESDFASDSAAVHRGTDPKTGRRYLEKLAFEVVWKQTRANVTAKAPRMIRRGVKRVFAVFVRQAEVAEWSKKKKKWVNLALSSVIEDACLARPLLVGALLDAAKADAAVVQGLEAKGDPEIERIRSEGRSEGLSEGRSEGTLSTLRAAILAVLSARGLEVQAAADTAVSSCNDPATLERWLRQAATASTAADALV